MFLVLWWIVAVWTVNLHNLTHSTCLFHLVSFILFPCSGCALCSINRGENASKEKQFQLSSNILPHKIQNDVWADRLWDWCCVLAQANDPCNFQRFHQAWVIEMCNNCDRGHYLTHFPFLLTLLCLYMPSCHNPLQISKVQGLWRNCLS